MENNLTSEENKNPKVTKRIWEIARGDKTRYTYQKSKAKQLKDNFQIPDIFLNRTDLKIIEALLNNIDGKEISYTDTRYITGISLPTIQHRCERMESYELLTITRVKTGGLFRRKPRHKYKLEVTKKGEIYYKKWKRIFNF